MVEGGRSGGDDAHGRAETNEPTRIETRRLHRIITQDAGVYMWEKR